MTHIFKVGDTGKTHGGYNYTVTFVDLNYMLVRTRYPFKEYFYHLNGEFINGVNNSLTLIPPTKRIQGWVNIYPTDHKNEEALVAVPVFADRRHADEAATGSRIACVHINIEEGEGLGNDSK